MLESCIKISGQIDYEIRRKNKIIDKGSIKNTIDVDLRQSCAKHLGDGTHNFGADDLFTASEQLGGSQDGKDGIAIRQSTTCTTMITTKDSGGDGTVQYIKFKGVYTATGAYTSNRVFIGKSFDSATVAFDNYAYAYQDLAKTLATGDQLTIYWTITFNVS